MYDEEKKYLDIVNALIKKEIEKTSESHRAISREKLSWEDRQRGQHLNNNAMMDIMYRRIEKLKTIVSIPYFGRMDFVPISASKPEKFYIGKTNLFDENNALYTIDWRTPVAGMYYDNSIGEASYEAPKGNISGNIVLKRQIIIENSELQKVLDVDLVGRDAVLQEYLDVHTNDRMKNIVASIQKQQNQVIRHPSNNDLIVQGIAGSGKTSVALHRIAYLMYLLNVDSSKSNSINSRQFMIIGPNTYFLDYISSVLPDLDVEKANQLTISDLLSKITKEKITVADQSKELQEYFKFGNNNGEGIENSSDFESALEKYISDLHNYYLNSDITFLDTVIFDKEFIASYISGRRDKFGDGISAVQKQLIERIKTDVKSDFGKFDDLLTKDVSSRIKELPRGSEQLKLLFEKRDLIRAELKTGLAKTIKNHFALANKTVLQHYINFITNLENYMSFEGIEDFKKRTLKRLSKKNISRDDIAPLLLLTGKLHTIPELKDTIHIVIDEAQDLSLLEFKAIKNLFPSATFSIFGDLNQAIFSYRSVRDWESVKTEVFDEKCDVFELNQSYRTTDEIMKEANKVSSYLTGSVSEDIVRHGEDVDYLRFPDEETAINIKNILLENVNSGNKSIAIITKTENEAIIINKKLKELGLDIHNVTFEDTSYNGGICTIACSLVKGLEFDATILVNVNSDVYDVEKDIDMKLLYVAMTRALHKTSILYTKELPAVLNANLQKTINM
ncbi:MAG: UvrD-helicase domain-containing protein [Bacilli bacterium]